MSDSPDKVHTESEQRGKGKIQETQTRKQETYSLSQLKLGE